jgi:hypothetical protein
MAKIFGYNIGRPHPPPGPIPSYKCELCDKPALYKAGIRRFCGDHKAYAVMVHRNVWEDKRRGKDEAEKLFREQAIEIENSQRHHRAKGLHRRPKGS